MNVVFCKDCEHFVTNKNESANIETSDYRCANIRGLIYPTPEDYCSRAERVKRYNTSSLDQITIDALIAIRDKQ
ncbi:MAG: hypothetical protein HUJ71_00420 [Pseudobutyrivibrio sp.]|nr:hypothetical protein [Clostridia bacterium]MCF0130152.1 hypothetical protein [Pseudobutyrivibrio sp.]